MKLWKRIGDVFYNTRLNMLYSCTKAIQPLRAQAIKPATRTALTYPNCSGLPVSQRATPKRMHQAGATKGLNRANPSCGSLPVEDHGVVKLWRPEVAQHSLSSLGQEEFHALGGLQTLAQQRGRQWQILHLDALKAGRVYFAQKYT